MKTERDPHSAIVFFLTGLLVFMIFSCQSELEDSPICTGLGKGRAPNGSPFSRSGRMSGQVMDSTGYSPVPEISGIIEQERSNRRVTCPGGDNWRFPRADTSNSGYSAWEGPLTNALKWTYSPLKSWQGSVDNQTITLTTDGSIFVGIDLQDHTEQGSYLIGLKPDGTNKYDKYPPCSQQVVDSSGTMYCTGYPQKEIVAINPDGSVKWRLDLYPNMASNYLKCSRQMYITPQRKLVVYEEASFHLEAGFFLWVINNEGYVETSNGWVSPLTGLALTCDSMIICSFGGPLRCYNDSLDCLWELHYPGFYFKYAPVTDQNCRIYCQFRDEDGHAPREGIIAIDGLGNEIWRVFYPNSSMSISPIARSETTLYAVLKGEATTRGTSLCAVHQGGWLLWTVPLKGIYDNNRAEVVVDQADRTFVSTRDYLSSFNSDGTLRWQSNYPGEHFRGLTLSLNGTLYAAGKDTLYAFGAVSS